MGKPTWSGMSLTGAWGFKTESDMLFNHRLTKAGIWARYGREVGREAREAKRNMVAELGKGGPRATAQG